MMRALSVVLFAAAFAVAAQDREIQQQLIQRQQQSDAFTLQLRQSQETLKVPPAAQPGLETRQLGERQRLENVSGQQLLDVKPDASPGSRTYERQKADDERRPLTIPARQDPQPSADQPRPLVAPSRGIALPGNPR